MNCTNCGSALHAPTGFCGTCGQPVPAVPPPPAWPPAPSYMTQATTQFAVPADLYTAPPPTFHGTAYAQAPNYYGTGNPHAELHQQAYGTAPQEIPAYYATEPDPGDDMPWMKMAIGGGVVVLLAVIAFVYLVSS